MLAVLGKRGEVSGVHSRTYCVAKTTLQLDRLQSKQQKSIERRRTFVTSLSLFESVWSDFVSDLRAHVTVEKLLATPLFKSDIEPPSDES